MEEKWKNTSQDWRFGARAYCAKSHVKNDQGTYLLVRPILDLCCAWCRPRVRVYIYVSNNRRCFLWSASPTCCLHASITNQRVSDIVRHFGAVHLKPIYLLVAFENGSYVILSTVLKSWWDLFVAEVELWLMYHSSPALGFIMLIRATRMYRRLHTWHSFVSEGFSSHILELMVFLSCGGNLVC